MYRLLNQNVENDSFRLNTFQIFPTPIPWKLTKSSHIEQPLKQVIFFSKHAINHFDQQIL